MSELLPDRAKQKKSLQKLKEELKKQARLNKKKQSMKNSKERSLEKSMLSRSQSSFENSLLQRVVLRANNRALARALETSKMTIKKLEEINLEKERENLILTMKLHHQELKYSKGVKDKQQIMEEIVKRFKTQFMLCADTIEELQLNLASNIEFGDTTLDTSHFHSLFESRKPLEAGVDEKDCTEMKNVFNAISIEEASYFESAVCITEEDSNQKNLVSSPAALKQRAFVDSESQQVSDLTTLVNKLHHNPCLQENEPPINDGTICIPIDMELTNAMVTPILLNITDANGAVNSNSAEPFRNENVRQDNEDADAKTCEENEAVQVSFRSEKRKRNARQCVASLPIMTTPEKQFDPSMKENFMRTEEQVPELGSSPNKGHCAKKCVQFNVCEHHAIAKTVKMQNRAPFSPVSLNLFEKASPAAEYPQQQTRFRLFPSKTAMRAKKAESDARNPGPSRPRRSQKHVVYTEPSLSVKMRRPSNI